MTISKIFSMYLLLASPNKIKKELHNLKLFFIHFN
ncbi:MAG: hypothetical protein K0R51_2747 [Cytophagaceae bacterium]|jgi:hypothetical protein|nr:hypothetical protein [Cytophagaceae bacterium]